LRFSDRTNPT